jgi:hypothetical protein
VAEGVPLALLLDTDDSLRRAGRMLTELGDPAGPGATPESRSAQTAVEAVLRNSGRRHDPAIPSVRDRDGTLRRAARVLEDLDHRLADTGACFS